MKSCLLKAATLKIVSLSSGTTLPNKFKPSLPHPLTIRHSETRSKFPNMRVTS